MEQLQATNHAKWPTRFIAIGAFLAALSVISSAYATHGNSLNGTSALMVQASLQLLQFHSIGLILVGILGQSRPMEKRLQVAGALFVIGCLLFSVNILLRAWHDIQTFKALIPWGGTSFILGWFALVLAYLTKVKPQQVSESDDQRR
jgi:uncharacterized membrane protein YgdD (TMEM256/DUF423 family)